MLPKARTLSGALKGVRLTHKTAINGPAWRAALGDAINQGQAGNADELKPTRVTRKVLDKNDNELGVLTLASARPLTAECPGNGGMRLWQYPSQEEADSEADKLGLGMEIKHATYNTGFAGAKLVCASDTPVGAWEPEDKASLMDAAAAMLNELDGKMFTGCDMNTTTEDMDYLAQQCPYVLAAVGNPKCCPNAATAYGVVGAIEASFGGSVAGRTLLVHGCGNVGAVVAAKLVELGAHKVMTVDIDAERAQIEGCVPVPHDSEWWAIECDAIVPCSSSGLLTPERAAALSCDILVGATNIPFSCNEAKAIAENERGVVFVHEGVSSAGAVIIDSVEAYSNEAFKDAEPLELYEFSRDTVKDKVGGLIRQAQKLGVAPSLVVPLVAEEPESMPVGARFELGPLESSAAASQPHGRTDMRSVFMAAQIARCSHTTATGQQQQTRAASTSAVVGSDQQAADVVIVGAGIMGLNIAYQLRRRAPSLSVLVLERAPAVGFGSSGYSTGFQRAYYSFDETMQFALDGMNAYKNWSEYLRDDEAQASFTETGALWMLGYEPGKNDEMVDRLARFGVNAERLGEAELGQRFPLMNLDPFPHYDENGEEQVQNLGPLSAVYEHGCGHIDSSTCLEDILRACRRDGAEVRMGARISRFVSEASSGRCTGVELEGGAVVNAGVAVVNAAGPWFNKLNETVGLELSTTALPTRIQVGHKWIPDEYCSLPFVADGWGPSGIYFMPRARNNQLVFGSVAHRFESEIVDPDDYNEALDPDFKQDYLNCLFHRLPGLPREGEIIGFSSMYTVNQDDVHPMIGETRVPGLWACNGFSGHGFKLAPAVGSLVAQQITGDLLDRWETSVAHDFMGPDREPLTLAVKTHFA